MALAFSTDLTFQVTNSGFGYNNSANYIFVQGTNVTKTITISNASTAFKINSFAAFVASNSGSAATNGIVTFVGTLVGGSTLTATVNVASTGTVPAGQIREGNNVVNGLSFAGTPLDGIFMTSLSVSTSAAVQFVELDHISFTTQAVVTNQFSISDVSQNEGNSGTSNFTFTVTRSSNTAASSVQVQSSNGTATTADGDYVAFPLTTVSFTAGSALTQTVNVVVNGDVTVEPNQTFTMTLSNPSGGVLLDATGTGTIVDDDAINEPFDDETNNTSTFSQSGNNFQVTGKLIVVKNGGFFGAGNTAGYAGSTKPFAVGNQGSFQITSPGKSFNIISADLYAAAVSGSEPSLVYTATNCTITFTGTKADGSGTVTHTAAITPSGTNVHSTVLFATSPFDGVQLSAISFSTPTGIQYLQVDNFKYGTATLTNTQLSIDDVSVVEGTGGGSTTATFTVTRTNNTTAFTVNLASVDGTATAGTDYTAYPSTTLTFTSGGALTQTVNVTVLKDATIEPNETFNMTLSGATNGTVYLKQTGIGTILNDDSVVETFEDETNNALTFSQNSVNFSTSGGFKVKQSSTFGSGSSTFYLTSSNNAVGNQGTFSITSPNKAFKLNFLDAWVGTSVTAFSSGSVTFTGTLFGGGTVTATKTITATSATGTGWQQNISFAGTDLENVLLTAIQVSTGGSLTLCEIDNFNYTVINTLPIIEVVDASNVAITNGGVAGTANNTDFGLRCLTGATQSKTYTIKNSGNTNLTLSGSPLAVLGGADASQFSITSQPTSPIAPGASTTFTVLFDPNTGGAKNATITLTSNDPTNSPYVINIIGIGGSSPTATFGASPDICAGSNSFTIPFSNFSANPTSYSISGAGITTEINRSLVGLSSPLIINLSSPAVFGTNLSYSITVMNGNGCVSQVYTGNVTVTAGPPATITPTPTAVCIGGIINLSAPAGATTYLWSGNGIVLANSNATTAVPTASGNQTYGVTVTTAGCSTVATTSVTVNANPTASPSSNTPVCEGNTLNLTSTTATSYLWTGPNSFSSTVRNPDINNVSIAAGGTYTLSITNASGCTATATTPVVINSTSAPTSPTATPSNFTVSGTTTLTASGCSSPSTISWYDSANPSVALPNNTPNISSNKTFFARCTGTNTCVSEPSANVSVTYTPCVPLASSPGNVGINWTGLVSTDWNDACNWNPKWVPDATNSAVVIDLKTNQPTISGTVPSVKLIYVNSGATLTVASGGTLNASSTTAVLTLQGGNLINDGTINLSGGGSTIGLAIGATASITNRGTITTNNLYGASLQFGNLTFTNESTGIFTGDFKANNNILTLTNSGTINYAGGTYALSLGSAGSSVINSGTISVTAGSGISNPSGSTITNNACGKILMTTGLYENAGTTINAGFIQMPNLFDFTNTGTFTNNGVLKANTVASITNNRMVITNACPIFTLAGSNNYTVSGIFTDAGATTSAGTYTSVGNKFTANNTIPTGTQTLYAQVTNGTCTFVVPFDFNNRKPTSVSVNKTTICTGANVMLSGACSSGTLTWYTDATGGSNIGTGSNLSQSPTSTTTYYAACEATNCVSGRVATSEVSVVSPPVATASSNSPVCQDGTLNITGGGIGTYSWTGPSSFTSTLQNPTISNVSTAATGTYMLTVTNAGCSASATTAVTVNAIPNANPSSDSPKCVGQILTFNSVAGMSSYAWTGPNSFSSSIQAPSISSVTTDAAGTYTLTVTSGSCTASATTAVIINQLATASVTPSTQAICSAGSITTIAITGTGSSYSWTRDNNSTVTGIAASGSGDITGSLTNTTDAPITVTFTITPLGTCSGTTTTASVVVNPIPTVTASTPSQTICSGQRITGISFNLPASFASQQPNPSSDVVPTAKPEKGEQIVLSSLVAGTVFNWTRDNTATVTGIGFSGSGNIPNNVLTNTTSSPVTVTFTITPSYTNAGTTCIGTPITVTVTVNPLPASATITDTGTTFCSGSSTTLSAPDDPNYTYAWQRSLTGIANPNSFTAFGGTAQTQVVTTSGVYRVIVTNQYNCSASDTTAVRFQDMLFNGSLGAGDAQQTGRMNRFAVVSTCAATTSYAGDFTTSGARYYDSYNITNPRNVPVCATIGVRSGCATSIFSAAYLGSFNPTSLSTNYLADHGSSFPNTGFYEVTIPANGTIVVVVHEVNPGTGCGSYSVSVELQGVVVAPTASSNSPICAGSTLNLTGTGTGTYSWSGPNSFTSTDQNPNIANATTLASGTYTISITNTNGCVSTATTAVTVNALLTASGSPSTQTICSGAAITTIAITGTATSYSWTRDITTAVTGIASSGSGDISGSLTNTTKDPLTVTFTITAVGGTCSGTTTTATVVVNPTPTVTASTPSQTICSGSFITGVTLSSSQPSASFALIAPDPSSDVVPLAPKEIEGIELSTSAPGTIFNWTRDNTTTVTGIPASGSGNISGILTNTTNSPIMVTFTVTPSYTNAGTTCLGTPITVTVTVNPNPIIPTITDAGTTFCGGSSTTLTAPADPTYTSYAWQRSLTGIANPNSFTAFGGTAQTQVVTTSGVYRVIVTNQYNCSASDTTAVRFQNMLFNGSLGAGDAQQTGRMNRFAVVSTCAAPTSYAGDFTTSGARFYDSYTVTNPTNAPVCATIGVRSGCGTSIFSAAYLGSFNPTSLSTNYLADHGSSFPNTGFYEVTIPANGTIVVVVHEVNPGTGCGSYSVSVELPGVTFAPTVSSNSPICAGSNLNLTGTGTGTYSWSGPNGFTSADQNPNIANATTLASGTYTINVTNANGCVSTATTAVTVNSNPTATASSNSPICAGTSLNLTGGGVGTYALDKYKRIYLNLTKSHHKQCNYYIIRNVHAHSYEFQWMY